MSPISAVCSWLSAHVVEPYRDAQTRRRVAKVELAFLEAERAASRGDFATAVGLFRRAFAHLTPTEQALVGSPAFLELWNVITDRCLHHTSSSVMSDEEADELFEAEMLGPILLGEARSNCEQIMKRLRASRTVARIHVRIEFQIYPAIFDKELAEIQNILE